MKIRSILFVCSGNTCRSPLAEGIMKKILDENNIYGIKISSCGTDSFPGACACTKSVKAANEMGIKIYGHRATQLSQFVLKNIDLVVCMGWPQYEKVKSLRSEVEAIVLGGGIQNPIFSDMDGYRKTANTIYTALNELVESLILNSRL